MSDDLTIERAEQLIRRMTDGLVDIKDDSGEFLEKRELPGKSCMQPDTD